jgi:putative endonuclease
MKDNAYVYFVTNYNNNALYIGVTNNLERRLSEHKHKINKECFTAKYNCCKLVYYEYFNSIKLAIARETQLKSWHRKWKNELVEKENPYWEDISLRWEYNEEPVCVFGVGKVKDVDSGSSPE